MASTAIIEDWDNDVDFQGDFYSLAGHSVSTAHSNVSSRVSVHSESVAGGGDDDGDWNVVLQPNDDFSTLQAIQSARQAGIPLPTNVPPSALLGGFIKKLGKKRSRVKMGDDWDNDLELPDGGVDLVLKPRVSDVLSDDMDQFDDFNSSPGMKLVALGRDARTRGSSVSGMSPSIGSITAESEDDELRGLELPEEPMDFEAILKKRRAAEAELSDMSQTSPAEEQSATANAHKKSKTFTDNHDDYLGDLDIRDGGLFDGRRRGINKNIRFKNAKSATSGALPTTTLNFHDRSVDKIAHMRSHLPRPVSGTKQTSRLEPVFETGASHSSRERRPVATTTSAQLLRSKRSMPVMSTRQKLGPTHKASVPSLSGAQHNSRAAQIAMPLHIRRESDPHNRRGAASPPPRPTSRLSTTYAPDTPSRPSRSRADVAPAALAREAAAKRTVTRPTRRRHFGDGHELDIFDDLPTSNVKESRFVKQPVSRGPPKLSLRQTQSRSDMRESSKRVVAVPDRMMTPAPPRTPISPTKGFFDGPIPNQTPSYLRDTAASRIAREARLSHNPRPRSEGPLMPLSTNWKAQVAARSPHNSPTALRRSGKRATPTLIKNMGANMAKTEKGMVYNPQTLRWEGNENTLAQFDLPLASQTPTPTGYPSSSASHTYAPQASPPRPALIAPALGVMTQGVQVNGGMVFDPRQMKWLKLKDAREPSGPLSPSATDGEEDAFAGIPDLPDDRSMILGAPAFPAVGQGAGPGAMASPMSLATTTGAGIAEVHEEFDLGPAFIARQREEEILWRRRCEAWFPNNEAREDDGAWRWAIRAIVSQEVGEEI